MCGLIGIGVCVVFSVFLTLSYAANPYKLGEVDYFEHKSLVSQQAKAEGFDFREAMIGSDGKVKYYTPPSILLTLLESPNEKNARAYIAWQKERMERINKAQRIIEKVVKENNEYEHAFADFSSMASKF